MPSKQKLGPLQTRLVKALRSGRYKQTKGQLESDGQNCCLGVACRIARCSRKNHPSGVVFEDAMFELPDKVMKKFAFRSPWGHLKNDKLYEGSLANMNDRGKTFDEIADFIESHPHQVFSKSV